MCGQGLLVIVWQARMFCHIGLQTTTTEIFSYMICQSLGDAPLAVRARMWYMHDGALAHFSRAVRDVANNTYHDRWVCSGGPTAWPLRSPDLNPLDLYLCGHLNPLVHVAPVDNEEVPHHRIVDACQTIHNFPSISERMRGP
jgi:hypothetical protein